MTADARVLEFIEYLPCVLPNPVGLLTSRYHKIDGVCMPSDTGLKFLLCGGILEGNLQVSSYMFLQGSSISCFGR